MKYFLPLVLALVSCSGRLLWENDVVVPGGRDDNYTNGVSYETSTDDLTFRLSQVFFTPDNLRTTEVPSNERPYAGHLRLEVEDEIQGIRIGCLGSCSYAEHLQKFVHGNLGFGTYPRGWHTQIEEGLTAAYYLRHEYFHSRWLSFPSRFDLGTDVTRLTFGPKIALHQLAVRKIGATNSKRFSLFATALGTYTAYNAFIDNSLFSNGTDYEISPLGADFSVGLKLYNVSFQYIWRMPEFKSDSWHQFGSLGVEW